MEEVHQPPHRQHEFTAQVGGLTALGQVHRLFHDGPITMGQRDGFIGLPQFPKEPADALGPAQCVANPLLCPAQVQLTPVQPLECVTIEPTAAAGSFGINAAQPAVKAPARLGKRRAPPHPGQCKPRGLKL